MAIRITRIAVHVLGKDVGTSSDVVVPENPSTSFIPFFRNNWVQGPSIDTAWMTDITTARASSTKERVGLRLRPLRFQTVLFTATNRKKANRLVQALFQFGTAGNPIALYSDRTQLAAAYTGGVGTLFLRANTEFRRFYRGQRIALVNEDFEGVPIASQTIVADAQYAEISDISPDQTTITIKYPLDESFAKGTYVYPMFDAELVRDTVSTAVTGEVIEVTVSFQEKSGMMTLPATTVRGTDVTFQTNDITYAPIPSDLIFDQRITGGVSLAVKREGQQYTSGRATVSQPTGLRPAFEFKFELTSVTRAEWWAWIRFFDTVKGGKDSFWVASPQNFFGVIDVPDLVTIEVEISGYRHQLANFFKYVAVIYEDDTIFVREIDSISESAENWYINIVPGDDLPTTVGIKRVTTAHICTMSDDFMREQWITDEVVSSSATFIESLDEQDVVLT